MNLVHSILIQSRCCTVAHLFLAILVAAGTGQTATAQRLVAGDAATNDHFGWAVAIDGNRALMGAPDDDQSGRVDSGSAYLFEPISSAWSQSLKLTASDTRQGDSLGEAVAIEGNRLIVGAPWNDLTGSAYIYELSGGIWSQTAKLKPSTPQNGARFGGSLAIQGDRLVIGSPDSSTDGGQRHNVGSAFVFERVAGAWQETARLGPSDPQTLQNFALGDAIALDGDRIAIGSRSDNDQGNLSGSVYIFERVGGTWQQTAKLLASDGNEDDRFGSAVALQGNRLFVGAEVSDHARGFMAGCVYVYERSGTNWIETAKLVAEDSATGDLFGTTLELQRERLLIGAPASIAYSPRPAGAAYVFEFAAGNWKQVQKLTPPPGTSNIDFGVAVDLDENTALVGAINDDHSGATNAGSAFVANIAPTRYTTLTLVPKGSTWKYLDDGSNQGTLWRGVNFTDASWREGAAELGYGDGDEATIVNCGPDSPRCRVNNYATTYFRKSFALADLGISDITGLDSLNVQVFFDDSAVVFLNGVAIHGGFGLGTNPPFDYYASQQDDDYLDSATQRIDPKLLTAGTNVLAVEVHQAAPTSPDMSFDLEMRATWKGIVPRHVSVDPNLQPNFADDVIDVGNGVVVHSGVSRIGRHTLAYLNPDDRDGRLDMWFQLTGLTDLQLDELAGDLSLMNGILGAARIAGTPLLETANLHLVLEIGTGSQPRVVEYDFGPGVTVRAIAVPEPQSAIYGLVSLAATALVVHARYRRRHTAIA